MTKLNEFIAVRKGLRARTETAVTAVYHQFQKPALYAGLTRTYQPREELGETLPSEKQIVQRSVEDDLAFTAATLANLFEVVATVDVGNLGATANLEVQGQVLIPNAPVAFLLFLGKQLTDLRTQVSKAPTLDPETVWAPDPLNGGARSEPAVTTRARKVPTVLVKSPATDKHPAQTEVYMRDEIVGDWTLTRFSGAISDVRKRALLGRIEMVLDGVKKAVEVANAETVTAQHGYADALFDYIMTPEAP